MRYEELPPISRAEFASACGSNEPGQIADAVLRLALHHPDFAFTDDACRSAIESDNFAVRRAGVLSIGHLARRTGRVSDTSRSRLVSLVSDPHLGGTASDALDDIATFTHP